MAGSLVHMNETIAAVATPPGTGGIAVIRISGANAIGVADAIFRGSATLSSAPSHTLHYGSIVDETECVIDDVVASIFRAPQSYTGEAVVEVSCHGGKELTQQVLARILSAGARHAEPGEFTRRAFLNGRIDLVQAEAVADLIHAEHAAAAHAARAQLDGKLSGFVREIRGRLIQLLSLIELGLDFVEEDVAFAQRDDVKRECLYARDAVARALASYSAGRVVRDGLKVCIAGKPNTGKSSLLNVFLGTRRALVTEIPGTTRDYIEERALVGGALVRFIDTAGLRDTDDRVEREGIELSMQHLSTSDLVLLVADASQHATSESLRHEIATIERLGVASNRIVVALNKSDLLSEAELRRAKAFDLGVLESYPTSARTGDGIDTLLSWIAAQTRTLSTIDIESDVMVTNARHAEALALAKTSLDEAIASLESLLSEEYIAADIRRACDALGSVIGLVTSDDVLHSIFSKFCIGK